MFVYSFCFIWCLRIFHNLGLLRCLIFESRLVNLHNEEEEEDDTESDWGRRRKKEKEEGKKNTEGKTKTEYRIDIEIDK